MGVLVWYAVIVAPGWVIVWAFGLPTEWAFGLGGAVLTLVVLPVALWLDR